MSMSTAWPALRALLAAALGVAAFMLLRHRYTCMIPMENTFWLLCALFVVGFVGFVAECSWACLRLARPATVGLRAATFGMALLAYVAVAAVVWGRHPTPSDQRRDVSVHATLAGFWSAGLLMETGAYSTVSCGY